MNRRMVFFIVGRIAIVEAALLLLPLAVAVFYAEKSAYSILISALIALAVGLFLWLTSRPSSRLIYAKEGFAIVAYAWLLMSAIGALPFVLSGSIPSYIDAFFETVSGFTTTGASILTEIESLDRGILFWRSFTHWIGGMGVLVFITAVVPNIADRSINILRAEMPGPTVGKLVPKSRDTAKILYYIYIGLTLAEMVLLCCGGMSLYESAVHTFGTVGTGGFGIKNDSISSYSSYIQWVITAFMLLSSINFNLYYLVLIGKIRDIFKSSELKFFLFAVAGSIAIVTTNVFGMFGSFGEAVRHSAFQVISVVSTTGYGTVNFDLWPELSKSILLILMILGACAGSTGGGLKIARVVILLKSIGSEVKKLLHPRSVKTVTADGKKLDEAALSGVTSYFAIYIVIIFVVFVLLSFDSYDMETNFSATLACFNNIGPGFGEVGVASNYAGYSIFSKVLLSLAMLLGRLEIFPFILGLNPMMLLRGKKHTALKK